MAGSPCPRRRRCTASRWNPRTRRCAMGDGDRRGPPRPWNGTSRGPVFLGLVRLTASSLKWGLFIRACFPTSLSEPSSLAWPLSSSSSSWIMMMTTMRPFFASVVVWLRPPPRFSQATAKAPDQRPQAPPHPSQAPFIQKKSSKRPTSFRFFPPRSIYPSVPSSHTVGFSLCPPTPAMPGGPARDPLPPAQPPWGVVCPPPPGYV